MKNKRFSLLCAILAIVLAVSMIMSSCNIVPEETTETSEETTEVTTETSEETTEETTETSEETTEETTETSEETTEETTETSEETTEETTETTEETTETSEETTETSEETTEVTTETAEETTEETTEVTTETTEVTTETSEETTEITTETETEPHFTITIEGMASVTTASDGSYTLTAPEKEGYHFIGWVTDNGEPFAAQGTVSGDVSISPVFEKLTDKGMSFSSDERVYMTEAFDSFPTTVGFKIKLQDYTHSLLMSNSIYWGPHISYEITAKGNPQIVVGGFRIWDAPKEYRRSQISDTYTFNNVTIPQGEIVDIYFVIDRQNAEAHCYINGELKQTVSITNISNLTDDTCFNDKPFVIGGSNLGCNFNYFNGEIYDLSVWSDRRTPEEIAHGISGSPEINDDSLMAQYVFYNNIESELYNDFSGNGHTLSTVKLWLDKSEVEEVVIGNGDYTFAVVGDTQSLVNKYPEKTLELYDWIVNNKDALNIKFVMGLGDITENASQAQFDIAWQSISKLSGKIPYTIVTGNHDKDDFYNNDYISENPLDYRFNKVFFNQTYLRELTGYFAEGDVRSSYTAFKVGDINWLVVNIDFGATDEMIEWAADVIEQYPDHRVIIITHAYLYRDGTTLDREECYAPSRYTPVFNDGDTIFNKLVSQYENIEMVIAGHDPHDHIVCSQVTGIHGNTITQLLVDPQYMDNHYGATGMVALLHFSENSDTVTVRYYSTAKDMYGSELSQFTVNLKDPDPKYQPTFTITVEGMDDVLTAPGGSYALTAPEKEGYRFMGWVTDTDEPFAQKGVISNDVSISPVFEKLTDKGLSFSCDERVYMTENLSAFPITFAFKIKLSEDVPIGTWYGVLISNSIRWGEHIAIEINANRNPGFNFGGLYYKPNSDMISNNPKAYTFSDVVLPVGEEIDLVIVIDRTNNKAYCYVNGELAQKDPISINKKYLVDAAYTENPFVIGGNTTGSNYLHFKGEMLSMSIWSDTRTATEIATGGYGSPEINDPNLLANYEFYNNLEKQQLIDMSDNNYDLKVDRLWLNTSEVEAATGYDYTFAVIGDTQSLSYKHPYAMYGLYDWIVNNRSTYNIQYVLGLGDITEYSYEWEWELSKQCLAKLSGAKINNVEAPIPYLMAMGNHDKYDFKNDVDNYVPTNRNDFLFNQYLTSDDYYMSNISGHYGEGNADGQGNKDVTCSYVLFEPEGSAKKWLIMTLDFGPTDEMLTWASEVIAAHEDYSVIITTHAYLYRDGTTIDRENDCYAPSRYNSVFNDGNHIYDKLITKHSNIVLVLSGHDPHDHIVCTQTEREDGSVVTQMLIDAQYMDNFHGATGMVALLHYTEETNSLTVRYYSTAKGIYGSESSQFTVCLD